MVSSSLIGDPRPRGACGHSGDAKPPCDGCSGDDVSGRLLRAGDDDKRRESGDDDRRIESFDAFGSDRSYPYGLSASNDESMLWRRYSRPNVADDLLLSVFADSGGSSIDSETADLPICCDP